MYAITSTSYRVISSAADLLPGETAAESVPQSLVDSITQSITAREATATNLRAQAEQALDGLRSFRDNASPTNAQVVAAVKLLCRVAIGLIRLQIAKLDAEN